MSRTNSMMRAVAGATTIETNTEQRVININAPFKVLRNVEQY